MGAFHSTKNSSLANSGYSLWQMEQYFPVGCANQSLSKYRAKKYKINQSKQMADLLPLICFDDFEVKTNDILSEEDDFIFSVQLAVTCEGILN